MCGRYEFILGVTTAHLSAVLLLLANGALASRTPLYIGGFFPKSGISWTLANETIPAIELAFELINNDSDILPGYELILSTYDSEVSFFSCSVCLVPFLFRVLSRSLLLSKRCFDT